MFPSAMVLNFFLEHPLHEYEAMKIIKYLSVDGYGAKKAIEFLRDHEIIIERIESYGMIDLRMPSARYYKLNMNDSTVQELLII